MKYTIKDNNGNILFSVENTNDFNNIEPNVKSICNELKTKLKKCCKNVDIEIIKNSNKYDLTISFWLDEDYGRNYEENVKLQDKLYNIELRLKKEITSFFKSSKFSVLDIDGNSSYSELYVTIKKK